MALETVAGPPDMRGLSRAVFVEEALVVTMSTKCNIPVEDGPPDLRQNLQFTPTPLVYTLNHLPDQFLALQYPVFPPSLTSTRLETATIMPIATCTTTSS